MRAMNDFGFSSDRFRQAQSAHFDAMISPPLEHVAQVESRAVVADLPHAAARLGVSPNVATRLPAGRGLVRLEATRFRRLP